MCFEMVDHSLGITATATLLPIFGWLEERIEATETQCEVLTTSSTGYRSLSPNSLRAARFPT